MKQIELAQRLGVSRAYITMLIKGERKPSRKLQKRISKLTKECSLPDTLLGNGVQVVGGSNPLTPTIAQIQKNVNLLTKFQIQAQYDLLTKFLKSRREGLSPRTLEFYRNCLTPLVKSYEITSEGVHLSRRLSTALIRVSTSLSVTLGNNLLASLGLSTLSSGLLLRYPSLISQWTNTVIAL